MAVSLSGGERRRLEITRALVTMPSLILLDEPFSGIDPIAVQEIRNIIKDLRERGMGILITDHNVRETLSITNRSYIVDEGRVLRHGTAEELVSDPVVRKTYLGDTFSTEEFVRASQSDRRAVGTVRRFTNFVLRRTGSSGESKMARPAPPAASAPASAPPKPEPAQPAQTSKEQQDTGLQL
jgi:ABC-type multidrug transport system ATPase subunit